MPMYTIYHIQANELDEKFIQALKLQFKDKELEIIVSEVDETSYLLQSQANRRRLLAAIDNLERNSNLVEVSLDSLQ
jgi:antitoxin YefM